RARLMLGAFVTGLQYVRGQQARQLLRQEVDGALERRDVLLAPATPIPAPRLGEKEATLGDGPSDVRSALLRFTRPFNLSGHPACSVACGFTTGGLPIGQQLVPETCAHPEREADAVVAEGPMLPGTRIRCTEEVIHRLGRIPIPFVRQMVSQKVAETARAENVLLVDVAFFERAATF